MNKDKWYKLAEQNINREDSAEKETENKIDEIYQGYIKRVKEEFKWFYYEVREDKKMEYSELFKYLTKEEIKQIENKINSKLGSKTQKIKGLKALLNFIVFLFEKKINEVFTSNLVDIYEEIYINSMYEIQKELKAGFKAKQLNKDITKEVIKNKWLGENYEERLKNNTIKLLDILSMEILRGIARGENPKDIAERIENKINISRNNALRIARTEFNNIVNKAAVDVVKDINNKLGVELFQEYRFLATLDKRTSEICQELDLKTFRIDERKVGINFPPMHPNCRSTFEVVVDDEELKERISKNIETGKIEYIDGNISYKEWHERFNK